MAWYRNHYRHDNCAKEPGIEWTDDWSSMSNDECAACGTKDIEPYHSVTLNSDPDPDEDSDD